MNILTFVSALGSGLIAGFFLAFSIVVMKALAQQPPPQGIAAIAAPHLFQKIAVPNICVA